MKPIDTKHTTHRLGAPVDWDHSVGPCGTLPVHRAAGNFTSFWKLSWRERCLAFIGVPVRLDVTSSGHPPVALNFDRP